MRPDGAVRTLTWALLLRTATAQAQLPLSGPSRGGFDDERSTAAQAQKPLQPAWEDSQEKPTKHSLFTKKLHHGKVCPSRGESQWTGKVTVSEGHDIFYWYADSRNDPERDPIIIMIAGGPGAASVIAVPQLTGPCWLTGDSAEVNPWSWNNNASMLFIDQPAGTGFSTFAEGQPMPSTEQETAKDFQQFLNIFFDQVFPKKRKLPIHIATGSYGGHFAPVYMHHILETRRSGSDLAFWGNITSLVLMSGLLDWTATFVGTYPLLCENRESVGVLNETECEDIAKSLPEQMRLGEECQRAYIGHACEAAYDHGVKVIQGAYTAKGGSPMNIRKKCRPEEEGNLCMDEAVMNVERYFNKERVKEELGVSSAFKYRNVNLDLWLEFHRSGAWAAPTTRELIDVLDAYTEGNKVGDVKVLVLNGNLDFVVNTPGNIWLLDRLGWSGRDEFVGKAFQPLPDGMAATGTWKATGDGRLAFLGIDDAGHMMPGYAREGSSHIINRWLQDGWQM